MSWKPRKTAYVLPGIEGSDIKKIAADAVNFAETETTEGLDGLIRLCDEIKRQAQVKIHPPLVTGGSDTNQLSIIDGGKPMPPLDYPEIVDRLGGA